MAQIPVRSRKPTSDSRFLIQTTDDGSLTLVDQQTGAAYHSGCGAAAETQTVYLDNSGVAERLRSRQATRVLELGLGTGMGMLMTLDWANQHRCPLEYVAIEHHWLPAEITSALALETLVSDPELVHRYHQWRTDVNDSNDSSHRWHDIPDPKQNSIAEQTDAPEQTVEVMVMDVAQAIEQLRQQPGRFDAIYFDPFDPATNPQAWQPTVIKLMRELLSVDGRLVSYCVNRVVRDNFARCGFDVQRVPGPANGKREVLVATPTTNGAAGNPHLIRKSNSPPQ